MKELTSLQTLSLSNQQRQQLSEYRTGLESEIQALRGFIALKESDLNYHREVYGNVLGDRGIAKLESIIAENMHRLESLESIQSLLTSLNSNNDAIVKALNLDPQKSDDDNFKIAQATIARPEVYSKNGKAITSFLQNIFEPVLQELSPRLAAESKQAIDIPVEVEGDDDVEDYFPPVVPESEMRESPSTKSGSKKEASVAAEPQVSKETENQKLIEDFAALQRYLHDGLFSDGIPKLDSKKDYANLKPQNKEEAMAVLYFKIQTIREELKTKPQNYTAQNIAQSLSEAISAMVGARDKSNQSNLSKTIHRLFHRQAKQGMQLPSFDDEPKNMRDKPKAMTKNEQADLLNRLSSIITDSAGRYDLRSAIPEARAEVEKSSPSTPSRG